MPSCLYCGAAFDCANCQDLRANALSALPVLTPVVLRPLKRDLAQLKQELFEKRRQIEDLRRQRDFGSSV